MTGQSKSHALISVTAHVVSVLPQGVDAPHTVHVRSCRACGARADGQTSDDVALRCSAVAPSGSFAVLELSRHLPLYNPFALYTFVVRPDSDMASTTINRFKDHSRSGILQRANDSSPGRMHTQFRGKVIATEALHIPSMTLVRNTRRKVDLSLRRILVSRSSPSGAETLLDRVVKACRADSSRARKNSKRRKTAAAGGSAAGVDADDSAVLDVTPDTIRRVYGKASSAIESSDECKAFKTAVKLAIDTQAEYTDTEMRTFVGPLFVMGYSRRGIARFLHGLRSMPGASTEICLGFIMDRNYGRFLRDRTVTASQASSVPANLLGATYRDVVREPTLVSDLSAALATSPLDLTVVDFLVPEVLRTLGEPDPETVAHRLTQPGARDLFEAQREVWARIAAGSDKSATLKSLLAIRMGGDTHSAQDIVRDFYRRRLIVMYRETEAGYIPEYDVGAMMDCAEKLHVFPVDLVGAVQVVSEFVDFSKEAGVSVELGRHGGRPGGAAVLYWETGSGAQWPLDFGSRYSVKSVDVDMSTETFAYTFAKSDAREALNGNVLRTLLMDKVQNEKLTPCAESVCIHNMNCCRTIRQFATVVVYLTDTFDVAAARLTIKVCSAVPSHTTPLAAYLLSELAPVRGPTVRGECTTIASTGVPRATLEALVGGPMREAMAANGSNSCCILYPRTYNMHTAPAGATSLTRGGQPGEWYMCGTSNRIYRYMGVRYSDAADVLAKPVSSVQSLHSNATVSMACAWDAAQRPRQKCSIPAGECRSLLCLTDARNRSIPCLPIIACAGMVKGLFDTAFVYVDSAADVAVWTPAELLAAADLGHRLVVFHNQDAFGPTLELDTGISPSDAMAAWQHIMKESARAGDSAHDFAMLRRASMQ